MERKRKANRIESLSSKKTGRKTRRREAEDAAAVENGAGAEDATGDEDTGGAKKTARVKKTAGRKKKAGAKKTAGRKKKARPVTTGVKTRAKLAQEDQALSEEFKFENPEMKMRLNRAEMGKSAAAAAESAAEAEAEAVEDEEMNPDGDGEEETGVGEEVETGVDKEASSDEENLGEEAEAEEAGDEVEEADTEEVQATAAAAAASSSSKGKGIKEELEGKANKNKRDFVIKYCKHSGPLFEARAEELKAAFEFGHDFNVAISNKIRRGSFEVRALHMYKGRSDPFISFMDMMEPYKELEELDVESSVAAAIVSSDELHARRVV